MSSFCRSGQWLVVAVLHAILVGCGASGDPARVAVRGEVDVGGLTAPDGTISFLPLGAGGPAATTSVKAGRYQFDRKRGPPPGRHRVLVVSAASSKQERFGTEEGARAEHDAASPQPRWQTEVDVPDETSCELGIHLK